MWGENKKKTFIIIVNRVIIIVSNHSIKVTLFRLYIVFSTTLALERREERLFKKIVDKKRSNLLFTDVLVLRWRYGL